MTTEEMEYFDAEGNSVPPALAEDYATTAVKTIRDGPVVVFREEFHAEKPKPILPYMEPDVPDEDVDEDDGSVEPGPGA